MWVADALFIATQVQTMPFVPDLASRLLNHGLTTECKHLFVNATLLSSNLDILHFGDRESFPCYAAPWARSALLMISLSAESTIQ